MSKKFNYLYIQAWSIFANLAQLEAEVNNYAWLYLHIRVWDAAFSLLLIYRQFYHSYDCFNINV
ncbi:hypothetical protein [Candidatus Marithrix sp. Canyon 246]|uniref:hypothetical protein n=1 Tax=Candidatus Marithrix sp. Canyon 246 TaxID=1827136 RepID=UPI00084A0027|nr:hypothetical protein [Candidatus Marithrix sp. Canyon 246]